MNRQANHSGTFIMLLKNSPSYSYVEDDNRTKNVGNVVMNVSYDPFGNVISGSLLGEYGFSTKPFVDGPDWYYYGFRYYDPVTGRWPNRDPIGERGGIKIYFFVLNMPTVGIDLFGERILIVPRPTVRPGIRPGPRWPSNGPRPNPKPNPKPPKPNPNPTPNPNPGPGPKPNPPVGPTPPNSSLPGDCSDSEHRQLQDEVNRTCKRKRACSGSQSCSDLADNLDKNSECSAARNNINNKCFRGGDAGHQKAAADAARAVKKCMDIMVKNKCCAGFS